jgi:dihydrodipicolinate synthase/N-acetylneuraminate lyase
VAEIICDEARGEASTVVGAIAEGAPRVLEQIREAQAAGGQAAVVTAPYYFGWSAEEIERFFARIADESPLPVILYDIPWRTHNPVARDTIVRLSEHPNIIGLKDTTTDAGRFVDLLLTLEGREDFALLQGSEPLALPSLLLGAAGAVFSLANLAPRTSVDLYEACRRGDLAEARRLQRVYNRLFAVFSLLDPGTGSIAGALGGLKVGLELMGIGTAKVHFPAAAPAREARAAVAALLREIPETAGRLLTGRG